MSILENPVRRLRVPDECVADDEHLVAQTKVHILIRQREIVLPRQRMDIFPLQNIFGADGVELRLDDGGFHSVGFPELRWVQRRANEKIIFENVFQRWFRLQIHR